ncbi:hypothetical protein EHR01_03465 [Leptospira mtsangambouensis]|uniref:Uncharacterized protein n=1 Tax=Leptospira mtsangambouensis TaxID=2484912 RepID=A0ABY2P304_9LEPT|nr:hypothetical protein EHR01_03465 [Leptospira mtsangambouensis]
MVSGLKLRGIDSPDGPTILVFTLLFVKKKSNKAESWFVLLDRFRRDYFLFSGQNLTIIIVL